MSWSQSVFPVNSAMLSNSWIFPVIFHWIQLFLGVNEDVLVPRKWFPFVSTNEIPLFRSRLQFWWWLYDLLLFLAPLSSRFAFFFPLCFFPPYLSLPCLSLPCISLPALSLLSYTLFMMGNKDLIHHIWISIVLFFSRYSPHYLTLKVWWFSL